jgi:hypothetical protein
MSQSKRGRTPDRATIAGGPKHEVRYEGGRVGTASTEMPEAVRNVGNAGKHVDEELKK